MVLWLVAVSAVCVLFFVISFVKGQAAFKGNQLKWRALYKQVAYLAKENTSTLTYLLWANALLSLVPCFWVGYYSYNTDWSFLILLFPIMWYYFWVRFFFWEKNDLRDQ